MQLLQVLARSECHEVCRQTLYNVALPGAPAEAWDDLTHRLAASASHGSHPPQHLWAYLNLLFFNCKLEGEKFCVCNTFSHHLKAAESQHKELEKQLQSLTQELTESEAESASLSGRLQTATQSLSSSEARCTQLEAELQEERSARLIVESELDMLSQQPISRVGDDSPPGSSARKAEAAQQELQDVRLAPLSTPSFVLSSPSLNETKSVLGAKSPALTTQLSLHVLTMARALTPDH